MDVGAAACSFLLPLLPLPSALHGSATRIFSAAHRRPIRCPRNLPHQVKRASATFRPLRLAPNPDTFRTGNCIKSLHRGVTVAPATLSTNQAPTSDPRSVGTESASPLPWPAMTRQPGLEPNPQSYLADGAQWPTGHLRAASPPEALLARAISRRLHDALAGRSARDRRTSRPEPPDRRQRPQRQHLVGRNHHRPPRTSPRHPTLGRRTPQTPNPPETVTRHALRRPEPDRCESRARTNPRARAATPR